VAHPCAVIGACAIHYNRWRTCSEFASGAPHQRSASDPGTRGAQCRSGVPHTRFARVRSGGHEYPWLSTGIVLTRNCHPLRGAVVDLWHADEKSEYGNIGFRYRGHVLTGPDGIFRFRTIVPAIYFGRTRHYHVKVQAQGSRLLTTQLYFPNEPANLRDGLFQRELLMRVANAGDDLKARFDFVLNIRD
jgi:protocatechuate 3,4-dioxygenase beta subunit